MSLIDFLNLNCSEIPIWKRKHLSSCSLSKLFKLQTTHFVNCFEALFWKRKHLTLQPEELKGSNDVIIQEFQAHIYCWYHYPITLQTSVFISCHPMRTIESTIKYIMSLLGEQWNGSISNYMASHSTEAVQMCGSFK